MKKRKINIIYHNNGYGLTKDANLLQSYFPANYNLIDIRENSNLKKAEINIFLEVLQPSDGYFEKYKKLAKINILIPNPEWYPRHWVTYLRNFDYIFCKTKHAEEVFSEHSKNTIFTSFTSENHFLKTTNKIKAFFHSAGKSEHKGTTELIEAFTNFVLPLKICKKDVIEHKTINVDTCYYSDSEFKELKNKYLFHIYPTHYEGFGQNIWESLSIGAIVLTTNSAPMNEFCADFNFDANIGVKHGMVNFYIPEIVSIQEQSKKAFFTDINELKIISKRNIEKWHNNDLFFKSQLNKILQNV